jgi:hypothetical protein
MNMKKILVAFIFLLPMIGLFYFLEKEGRSDSSKAYDLNEIKQGQSINTPRLELKPKKSLKKFQETKIVKNIDFEDYLSRKDYLGFDEKEYFKKILENEERILNQWMNLSVVILNKKITYSTDDDSEMVQVIKKIIFFEKVFKYADLGLRDILAEYLFESLNKYPVESFAGNKIFNKNITELFAPVFTYQNPERIYQLFKDIEGDLVKETLGNYFKFTLLKNGERSMKEIDRKYPI